MEFTEKKCLKIAFLAIFALFLLSATACDTMPQECLSRLEKPFYAETEGAVDGQKTSADIFCDPTEHKTKEIYTTLSVTFHEPASLDGITVTLRSDGKATVRLGSLTEEMPLYSSLTEPFSSLFRSTAPSRITKTDTGFVAETESNGSALKYHFNSDGMIERIEGEIEGHKVDLRVTKFEQK